MRNSIVLFFGVLFSILILILFLYLSLRDQGHIMGFINSFVEFAWSLLTNLTVLMAIFLSGIFASLIVYILIQLLDGKIDPQRDLTKGQKIFLGSITAVLFALFYIQVFHWFLSIPGTWLRTIATNDYFGWQPWTGEFDRSPTMWSIYGFITFLIGFFYISPWIEDRTRHLSS